MGDPSGTAAADTAAASARRSAVRYERDDDGIVRLVLDDPERSANTMNRAYVTAMGEAVDRLEAERDDPGITGVIVTSAKSSFFAGGDLPSMVRITPDDTAETFAEVETIKAQLRRLETLGLPVVAAVNGTALGGGLEVALACHRRIAVDDTRTRIGLPEVTLGLLPGGGGVTRTVRMLGLQRALTRVLLEGRRMRPRQALEEGLVDELVGSPDELIPAARRWITEHRDDPDASSQPWDRRGYKMPGGTPSTPGLARMLPAFPSTLRKQLKGADYHAPKAILSAAVEGAQVDFDTASRIESRYLVGLLTGQQFKDMAQAFFFDLQYVNSGGSRPADVPPSRARKAVVLGAGMMGAGIAYECARAGIDVVLKDVSASAAERGKAHSADLLDGQVQRGRISAEQRDQVLARIHPTDDPDAAAGADLVIEAVFEDPGLKHRVYAEIEPVVAPDALLCSNTSTLPITLLAEGVQRQRDFVGLHFFSPVHKMPLIEVIVGRSTSDEALARAYDVARQLGKTPIVVNDSRGFFTSRVFGTLIMEAAAMLAEGVDPVRIERAASMAGFPAPPLAMFDEVALTLAQHIRDAGASAEDATGDPFGGHPGMALVDRMVDEFGRKGRAGGAGFYDYPAEGPKRLWPGLWEHFAGANGQVPFADLQQRFTFVMALETVRCLDEGVLRSVPDANVGSILGIGFPPLHGGALQYVNGFPGGPAGFVERARELADRYGERFVPPASLVERAAADQAYA